MYRYHEILIDDHPGRRRIARVGLTCQTQAGEGASTTFEWQNFDSLARSGLRYQAEGSQVCWCQWFDRKRGSPECPSKCPTKLLKLLKLPAACCLKGSMRRLLCPPIPFGFLVAQPLACPCRRTITWGATWSWRVRMRSNRVQQNQWNLCKCQRPHIYGQEDWVCLSYTYSKLYNMLLSWSPICSELQPAANSTQ